MPSLCLLFSVDDYESTEGDLVVIKFKLYSAGSVSFLNVVLKIQDVLLRGATSILHVFHPSPKNKNCKSPCFGDRKNVAISVA